LTPPLDILRQYWGHSQFRPLQSDIIESVLAGKDTLALLPTGGGKSVCFQVPGLCMGGLTLVISPLIALMQDQVNRLTEMGVPAAFINATLPRWQVDARLQDAVDGKLSFLYLAPERLQSEMFRARLAYMPVKLLAIDEAHCISQWGHDFRPDYLTIHEIRDTWPHIPILALTASAPPQVQQDILAQLRMRDTRVFAGSFRRSNLRFLVLDEGNVHDRMLRIFSRTEGSAIVYARTRKQVEDLSRYLTASGFSALPYHAGLTPEIRAKTQESWINNEVRIITATNAFGMGIDKGDVRLVVHYQLPADPESYYQEAGRAGRDGQDAMAVAFNNPADLLALRNWAEQRYPVWEVFLQHYHFLFQHFRVANDSPPDEVFEVDLTRVAKQGKIAALPFFNSLKLMDREGLIAFEEEPDDFGYLQFLSGHHDLLAYKANQPALAPLIDFALRQAGGAAFTRAIPFLPHVWAIDLGLTLEKLTQQLHYLASQQVVQYQPPADQPRLRFLQPYRPLSRPMVNWDRYEALRQRAQARLEAVIHYTTQKEQCRSLVLQHYFGEKTHEPCGVCDVCAGKRKKSVGDQEFRDIRQAIVAFVQSGKRSYRDVLLMETPGTQEQREKVLRYLLDKEQVLLLPGGFLSSD
jgi:ATP-dependent DNA helicase RecQ